MNPSVSLTADTSPVRGGIIRGDNPSGAARHLPLHKGGSEAGSLKWRRCLVDEPEEGQLVLVVDPDIASMPDVCAYLGGQFVDGVGRGDAMEVKSFWLWLPLPPFPWEVKE